MTNLCGTLDNEHKFYNTWNRIATNKARRHKQLLNGYYKEKFCVKGMDDSNNIVNKKIDYKIYKSPFEKCKTIRLNTESYDKNGTSVNIPIHKAGHLMMNKNTRLL